MIELCNYYLLTALETCRDSVLGKPDRLRRVKQAPKQKKTGVPQASV
jgi:hypothetical protein